MCIFFISFSHYFTLMSPFSSLWFYSHLSISNSFHFCKNIFCVTIFRLIFVYHFIWFLPKVIFIKSIFAANTMNIFINLNCGTLVTLNFIPFYLEFQFQKMKWTTKQRNNNNKYEILFNINLYKTFKVLAFFFFSFIDKSTYKMYWIPYCFVIIYILHSIQFRNNTVRYERFRTRCSFNWKAQRTY